MNIIIQHKNTNYCVNLSQPHDISIPIKSGRRNPNCYYAPPVEFQTIRFDDFTGSVDEGGPVNYQTIKFTPHGNGTHTECYGHISSDKNATINKCLTNFHCIAQLLTCPPQTTNNGDHIIHIDDFLPLFTKGVEAVVIRTTPNDPSKLVRQYSGTNPPYLDVRIIDLLRAHKIGHLLVDLPSVDPETDGGALRAHRSFWDMDHVIRKNCTITELIYVDNKIPDGLYLLNLQITSFETDASPSKPILFKMTEC